MKLTITFSKNEDKNRIKEIRKNKFITQKLIKSYQNKYLKKEELVEYKTEIAGYRKSELYEFQCFLEELWWIDRKKIFVEFETGYGNVGIRLREEAEAFLEKSINSLNNAIEIIIRQKDNLEEELRELRGESNKQIIFNNKEGFEAIHREVLKEIGNK